MKIYLTFVNLKNFKLQKIILSESRNDKLCKRPDVAVRACCLQRSHIFCTSVCRNHHPVIAAGGQHHIHQETAQAL